MIALLTACLFFEIFVHVLNLHQQKRALKLRSATLRDLPRGLRFPVPLDKGNKGSGNGIGYLPIM